MPDHKFGRAIALSKINWSLLDNTEVDGLDNLYEAEGIIKEASTSMADFYGAPFILGNQFAISSVKLGADIVINSLHKTLPSLTQSALLHICLQRIEYRKVIRTL